MPDNIFSVPRVAAVYDPLDPDRSDLDVYRTLLIDELGARSVLDIGCGTGTFAVDLVSHGLTVTGLDPAPASIEVARSKPGADRVRWITGTVEALADPTVVGAQGLGPVDAVTMTANVAQVFIGDDEWRAVLRVARDALRPGGTLVFESRRPEVKAWERWTRELSRQLVDVPGEGPVEDWVQVTAVDGELVTFESPTIFHADGTRIDSTSTLRFRTRDAIETSIAEVGLRLRDVRDAPDRPGYEWVYLADRPGGSPVDR